MSTVLPSGGHTFDPGQEYAVIGHLPENAGEHYVSLSRNHSQLVEIIARSRQINLQQQSVAPSVEHDHQNLAELVNEKPNSFSKVKVTRSDSLGVFERLPLEIRLIIFEKAIGNDIVTYNFLRDVSTGCREIIESLHKPMPEVYLNPSVLSKPEMEFTISVRKLMKLAGKNSGLLIAIRAILQSAKNWVSAWLVLSHIGLGWYAVENVFWKCHKP